MQRRANQGSQSDNLLASSIVSSHVYELYDAVLRLNSVRRRQTVTPFASDVNDPDSNECLNPVLGHRSGSCARFWRTHRVIRRTRQTVACDLVCIHSLCVLRSGSCLSTQFAAYPTMPGYSFVFLKGVPQSAQLGIASPGFSQTRGACTKRYSDPSGRSVQSPNLTRGLSVRGRGISMISVRRLRPSNHRATFSRAAARDSAEPIG